MTLATGDLALYALAVFILFLTPGPVWVALLARGMAGGFQSAWPLALGVVVGDVVWPLLAILGLSWFIAEIDGLLIGLRWMAAVIFLIMGVLLVQKSDLTIGSDSRLTRPGMWAGFVAGVLVILGNPKAVLFYMGVLPGFFDLSQVTGTDILFICFVSMVVPLSGNLLLAAFFGRIRRVLANPRAVKRLNLTSGWLLVLVGCVIPFT